MKASTRLEPAAIGEIRPTDVVTLTLDRLALHAGVIPTNTSVLPAGLPAIWSFAEVMRRGCQVALDLQPDELQVGLQPARINDLETRRIFLADRLENGAGYAPELAEPSKIKEVLEGILGELTAEYESVAHSDCTESCPDCLRSWDNRRLHGALDWRLALDVAALAAGLPLPTERWLSRRAAPRRRLRSCLPNRCAMPRRACRRAPRHRPRRRQVGGDPRTPALDARATHISTRRKRSRSTSSGPISASRTSPSPTSSCSIASTPSVYQLLHGPE